MNVVYELLGVDNASEAIKKVEGSFGKLQSSWMKLTGALALGGSVAYLRNIVEDSIKAADALNDLSQQTGVSVETLSGLQLAAKTSGLDMATLGGAINKLQKNMVEAQTGNIALATTFKAMGVDINGGTKEALYAVADALARMPEGAQKTALAMEVFGKTGAALIPFLNQGAAGLKEMEDLSAKLGLTLSNETAASAGKVADVMDIMGMQSKGFANSLMQSMLPTLSGLSKMWLDNAGQGGAVSIVVEGLTNAFKGLVIAVVGSIGYAQAFGQTIVAVIDGINKLWETGSTDEALNTFNAGFDKAKETTSATNERIHEIATNTMPQLEDKTVAAAKALQGIAGRSKEADEAFKRAQKAAEEFAGETDKLIKSTKDWIEQQKLENAQGQKLTDGQKKMLEIGKYLRENYQKLTEQEVDYWREQINVVAETEKERDSHEKLKKTLDDFEKAQQKAVDAQLREVDALKKKADDLDNEIKKVGLTKDQIADLELARLKDEAAILREKAALMALADEGYGKEYEAIQARIKALDTVIDKQDTLNEKNRMVEAAKAAKDEWDNAGKSIEGALTDALVKGFDSGKSAMRSLRDYIVNTFKTQIVQSVAKALTGALTAGFSSMASAGGNLLSSAFGGGGGGAAGGAGGGGSSIGSSLISSIAGSSALGSGIMAGLFGEATFGGTMAAAGSLIGTGTVSGGLAGLGMGLGAIAPYALAAYVAYRIISGKGTGRDRSPAKQNYTVMDQIGEAITNGHFSNSPNIESRNAYADTVGGLVRGIAGVVAGFGGTTNKSQFGLYTSVSPDGKGGQTVGIVEGRDGSLIYRRDVNGANDTVGKRIEEMLPGMFLAGLQNSNLPKQIADYFSKFSADTIDQATLDKVVATAVAAQTMAQAVAPLGGIFGKLSDLSVEARTELAGLTGGLDQFIQKVSGYVSNYYSEGEQKSLTARSILDSLTAVGLDAGGLTTRKQFREMLESRDITTESGRRQLAELLNVQGEFAQLADYLEAQGLTLDALAANAPTVNAINATTAATTSQTTTLSEGLDDVTDAVEESGDRISTTVETEVRDMKDDVTAALAEVAAMTRRTADILDRWSANGMPATEAA